MEIKAVEKTEPRLIMALRRKFPFFLFRPWTAAILLVTNLIEISARHIFVENFMKISNKSCILHLQVKRNTVETNCMKDSAIGILLKKST